MSSIDEKIARAQAAQSARPIFKDVTVSLDSQLADERAALLQQLGVLNQERQALVDAAKGTLTLAPDTAAMDKEANAVAAKIKKIDRLEQDSLVTIRVYRLKGDQWIDTVAGHPARGNSAIDRGVGYNVNTLTVAVLVTHGRIIDGDKEVTRTLDEWAVLTGLLAGGDFVRIVNAVFEINVLDAQKRTESLKNSFEAATASAKK